MTRQSLVSSRAGFTLVEVLTATVLTLILMSILTGVFSQITDAVNTSRATIELNSQLTGVAFRLQKDLEGYTVRPDPGRNSFHDGYFTVVEGPLGAANFIPDVATLASTNSMGGAIRDTTLGDRDDIIMWTTRSRHEPFQGRLGNGTFISEVAEVAWFLRGTTLYRRIILVGNPTIPTAPVASTVAWWDLGGGSPTRYTRSNIGSPQPPQLDSSGINPWDATNQAFYGYADLSVRLEGGTVDTDAATRGNGFRLVPNTLADLAIPKNRYCFPTGPLASGNGQVSDIRVWSNNTGFGLPVLGECSDPSFPFPTPGGKPASVPANNDTFDQLLKKYPYTIVSQQSGRMNADPASDPNNYRRINEDVIMANVIGFDVKVWDPGAPVYQSGGQAVMPGQLFPVAYSSMIGGTPISYGAYVNLGYAPTYVPAAGSPPAYFNGLGDFRSKLQAGTASAVVPSITPNAAVYDTYTDSYDNDGIDQDGDGIIDPYTNGFDDNSRGGIDDVTERELPPPYAFPLRGIQITIRVIEPDTQQIREVVVQQDFVLE